jgi:SulP family sulfate permease
MLEFQPKFFSELKSYNKNRFFKDLISGVIVAIVALPLSIAFGIASGVTPQAGLITAVIAGFLISFLGGSKVQIGGPTGAFIVIIYGVVTQFGVAGLATATVMAGTILILMGVLKIGSWIRFISAPLVIGFTNGIGIIIFSSQIKDFFGLTIKNGVPPEFIDKWEVYFENLSTINIYAVLIAVICMAIIILSTKFKSKIPGPFIALIVGSLLVYVFNMPVETIGDRFGTINFTLKSFVMPDLSLKSIQLLIPAAITIAMLGAIESLLSAVVSDGIIGDKHKPNTELLAQGIANFVTPFFGGLPATGAIVRTVTNIKNGGTSPVAGMMHAVSLALILYFFANLVSYVPMATLASILVIVSYNMCDWKEFFYLSRRSAKTDALVLFITFCLTVMVDLTVAIGTGLVLSSFFFMDKMYKVSDMDRYDWNTFRKKNKSVTKNDLPKGVIVLDPSGAFFFGASAKFSMVLDDLEKDNKYIIFRLNRIYMIDATGIKTLKEFIQKCQKFGAKVVFTEGNKECKRALRKARIHKMIDEGFIVGSVKEAIDVINKDLGHSKSTESIEI